VMLVPVREYASASEMLQALMAIRRTFRSRRPPVPVTLTDPASLAPKPESVLFFMTADMATPPDLMPEPPIWRRHTVRDVLNVVCDVWGVDLVDVVSARRTFDVMRPRQAAYALACKFTTKTLPEIARLMGGRDHSTILHGRNKMRPLMDRVRDKIRPDATLRQWAETLRLEADAFDDALRSQQSERTRTRRRRGK